MDIQEIKKVRAIWHDLNLACKRLNSEKLIDYDAEADFVSLRQKLDEFKENIFQYKAQDRLDEDRVRLQVEGFVHHFETLVDRASYKADEREIKAGTNLGQGYTVRDLVKDIIPDYWNALPQYWTVDTNIDVKEVIDNYRSYESPSAEVLENLKSVAQHFERVAAPFPEEAEKIHNFIVTLSSFIDFNDTGNVDPRGHLADFNDLLNRYKANGREAPTVERAFRDITSP